MVVITIQYHIEILLMIRPTGTHSQIYTGSHRYRHTDAYTYARARTCSHTHTLSVCVHTLSFKLINMDGYIYTHHVQQEDSRISPPHLHLQLPLFVK